MDNIPDSDEMTSHIFSWFTARGINTPLNLTIADNAIQLARKETTIERKLEWLRKSVRPAYAQLKLLGWQTEADDALGVTDNLTTIIGKESE